MLTKKTFFTNFDDFGQFSPIRGINFEQKWEGIVKDLEHCHATPCFKDIINNQNPQYGIDIPSTS